ncbi:MAG: c-type cytochrome [Betaproteobacteria bacterium]
MRRHSSTAVVGILCFVLGVAFQRFYGGRRAGVPAPAGTRSAPSTSTPSEAAAPRAPAIRFDHEPLWAYGFDRPPKPGEKAQPQAPPSRALRQNEDPGEQTRLRRVDGSSATYSLVDIRDAHNAADWFPGDHLPMPGVVAHGPARLGKLAWGCASCHLPNGHGRPENAPPGGLPVTYFVRQIHDFRSGLRRTADPRKPNTYTMINLARAMTDEEVEQAARYFSAITWTPWIRVVETNLVPKTRISGNLSLPIAQARTEPIAGRIIEVPEDVEQSEVYRNPHSGFLAYVPVGSVAKGRDLVKTGGMRVTGGKIVQGRTTPCGTCHGPDLLGVADVPPIAGRSPSYLVRQLWDMQQGTRNGASAQLMKLVVANLTEEDMTDIAAYVASLPPSAVPASTRLASASHAR